MKEIIKELEKVYEEAEVDLSRFKGRLLEPSSLLDPKEIKKLLELCLSLIRSRKEATMGVGDDGEIAYLNAERDLIRFIGDF